MTRKCSFRGVQRCILIFKLPTNLNSKLLNPNDNFSPYHPFYSPIVPSASPVMIYEPIRDIERQGTWIVWRIIELEVSKTTTSDVLQPATNDSSSFKQIDDTLKINLPKNNYRMTKVGRVFPVVIWSEFRLGKYRDAASRMYQSLFKIVFL